MSRQYLLENRGVVFAAKPDAVPYNYRISYKVSQICLILAKSCKEQSGCAPTKLHMISFALCFKAIMDKLIDFAHNEFAEPPTVRFDPAVNRAVTFAIADKLICQQQNGKYVLTDKGKNLVAEIDKDSGVLLKEKKDLQALSINLSDAKIRQLSEVWRNKYAED